MKDKKASSYAKFYALATQGIFTMLVLLGLGYYIGYLINKDSFWPPLLACIGVICGVVIFVTYLLLLTKGDDKKDDKES